MYQNVKNSSSLSKIVKNIVTMFIKGLDYLKGWAICQKNKCIIDLSELLQLVCHTLKEISKTIFWKTFKNFVELLTARESRKVIFLLRWLWAYKLVYLNKFDWNIF